MEHYYTLRLQALVETTLQAQGTIDIPCSITDDNKLQVTLLGESFTAETSSKLLHMISERTGIKFLDAKDYDTCIQVVSVNRPRKTYSLAKL